MEALNLCGGSGTQPLPIVDVIGRADRGLDTVGCGRIMNLAETGLLERLAKMGELAMYQRGSFWQRMDTDREMQLLNDMWQTGKAPRRVRH